MKMYFSMVKADHELLQICETFRRFSSHELSTLAEDNTDSPATKAATLQLETDQGESHLLDRAHRQMCLKSVNSQTDERPFLSNYGVINISFPIGATL